MTGTSTSKSLQSTTKRYEKLKRTQGRSSSKG